ncbi:MAG: nicotinate phosphoribosyltransferase [Candidatus Brocadia sp. AMX2]|uniref:Nicotinate phosphoribosyltransferase n=2 Tax=Candidatus Brocadia TaxID=380240 RepID=A0ABQ0JUH5_9BACT|nr:nicotinate phosphoribosyltransferase [Candidatus Brocadia sp. AMX2]KXK29899.1 MAG: putative nicotinate phosphoribosyltransferase [Candidatus Brocadia sinica]MBC6932952.1 nicotinate phosphoribosyltransferase [Candidatus Brocadia sp.]MBL1169258.1 nicotinate phosphoribosyltransferase [Candidatus Brocadia sp. AMX1]GAN32355.1 putative nicotinate phosphoribosyltransferase [Candidatus Brocadia sinica JPN1]KAA0241897.1 MAG: nicotinate phosphoribosyltransferase [Candidatus Brocadia sp. AMX2]
MPWVMKEPKSLFLTEDSLGIVTDLYQLTMAAGYFEQKMHDIATFELFVRNLPKNRSYLIVAGLEQVLHYLTHITFSPEIVQFLRRLPIFNHVGQEFFEYLKNFTFRGDVYAIPEGTIAFADEPMLRVTAPIIETQLVETYLLSMINFQTSIATKASRIVYAAQGCEVIDFGTRRAHGPQASVLAARSCFIGGCKGTSNVFAACELNIPAVGTVAHSWVMAFENEQDSFRKFHEIFPDNTTLLIDTYDTLAGARHAVMIGKKLKGVRIDSGNLLELSKEVRRILDSEGLQHVKIVASGDLNEDRIDDLLRNGAPIDSFGVGTEMVTSKDAPALGGVYKLVEQEHNGKIVPRMKFSEDKLTYPCKKQVYRIIDKADNFVKDVIGLEDENLQGMPLLIPVIKNGKICYNLPTVHEIQRITSNNLAHLPQPFKRLKEAETYPVTKSQGLEAKRHEAEKTLKDINVI